MRKFMRQDHRDNIHLRPVEGVIKGVDHFIGAFREKSSTIEKCDNLALVLFGNVYN